MAPSGRGGRRQPQAQQQQHQTQLQVQATAYNAQTASPDVLSIQRGRFVRWQPSPVICSAATADGTVAAVGREDGTIELWDTLTWQLLKHFPGSSKAVLSALAWLEDDGGVSSPRLVSGGLDGSLTEWDRISLQPAAVTDSFGGAVWALAVQPPQADGTSADMAVACDDGVLRMFGPDESGPGLQYRRSFGRIEGRVLSLAWHPSGGTLVSGHSDGCLRAWDASSAREIYRITAGKGSCVWTVLVLPDGTLVSGESSGHVRFWDGRFGTLLHEFREHLADVLSLAASPTGDTVFAAGVDPRLAVFQRTRASAAGMDGWLYVNAKRPHTHDVRTLLTLVSEGEAPLLLSGGNDAQLLAHSCDAFMQHHPTRVCRIPQRPLTCTAAAGQADGGFALLAAHGADVDIWRLPASAQQARSDGNESVPAHLARISNKSGNHILAAAVSSDGARVAFSDANQLRVLDITAPEAAVSGNSGSDSPQISVTRRPLPDGTPPAHQLHFAADGRLLASAADGTVRLIDLEGSPALLASFTECTSSGPDASSSSPAAAAAAARERLQPTVAALAVTPGSGGLAAAASGSQVHLYSLADLAHRGRVLLHGVAAVAMAFTPDGSMLAVATAGKAVHVFDVATRRPAAWMAANGKTLQASLDKVPGPVLGLSFDPTPQAASLLIAMPHAFCYVCLRKDLGSSGRKRRRQAAYVVPEDAALHAANVENFRAAKLGNPCLLLEYTGPATVVLLEHDWTDVWASLPAPMYRHRYGT